MKPILKNNLLMIEISKREIYGDLGNLIKGEIIRIDRQKKRIISRGGLELYLNKANGNERLKITQAKEGKFYQVYLSKQDVSDVKMHGRTEFFDIGYVMKVQVYRRGY
jgi:hypothetical protein